MTTASRHPRVPVADVEAALAVLRRDGGRVSAARRALLEGLFGAGGPVSAERLAAQASLDVASTYRSLEHLEHLGLARHVHLGHGPGLYELVTEGEREYLVCDHCGSVRAVEPDRLDAVREAIRQASGYDARFTHFPIVGLCAPCAQAEHEPTTRPATPVTPSNRRAMSGDDHTHEHPHAHAHAHGDEVHSHPHSDHDHDHTEHEHEHSHGDRVHSHPHLHEEGLEQAHAHPHEEEAETPDG